MMNLSSIKQNRKYFLLLLIIFLLTEIIIDPFGNFSLNDDWEYAQTVKLFHEQGIWNTGNWGRASLFMHVLFGDLFISVFGNSLTVLRFSTLFLSLTGIVFVFLFFSRFVLKNPFHSFLLTLLFLFDPLYLNLSNSFMTDVPFIATIIPGIYFYYIHKKESRSIYLVLSILFFCWSILIRQLGLCFIIGIGLTDLIANRKPDLRIICLVAVPALSLLIFEYWYHSGTVAQSGNSYSYVFFKNSYPADITSFYTVTINFLKRWAHYISLTGFVLFPLLIPYLVSFVREKKYLLQKKQVIMSVILMIPVIWSLRNFPIGNYLYNCGVGPETSYDIFFLKQNLEHAESTTLFFIIKALSFSGSFSLLLVLTDHLLNLKNLKKFSAVLAGLFLSLFFYYLFLARSEAIFDRYIMVFSLLIIPAVVNGSENIFSRPVLFYCCLGFLILFSVFTTKDYLNGNRMRWAAVDLLKEQNISDIDINAGYEHEAGLLSDSIYWYDKWTNQKESKYLISFGSVPHYEKLSFLTYKRYIPFKTDTVFVLKLVPRTFN
jgi:hypothetical protein